MKRGGYIVSLNGKHLGIQIKDTFVDGTIWTDTGEKKLRHIYPPKVYAQIHLKYTIFVI